MKNICAALLLAFINSALCGVSLVYNLRISETTRRQLLTQKPEHPSIASAVLVDQFYERKDSIRQFDTGLMAVYVYLLKSAYIKLQAAVGHVEQDISLVRLKLTRNQTDDVLLMAGYGFAPTKKTHVTISSVLGIPTHADTGFEGVEFGTGHVGVGFQADSAWFYTDSSSLMAAFRYVYFVPRHVNIPAVPGNFTFCLGNLVDLMFSHLTNIGRHKIEFGYNPTFDIHAKLVPPIASLNVPNGFMRSSFYANYIFMFKAREHISALGLGFSYGFDHRPKIVGYKNIFTVWGVWGLNF